MFVLIMRSVGVDPEMRRNEVEDGVVAHPSKSVSNEFVKLLITGVVVGGCVHVAILGAGVAKFFCFKR